MSRRSIVCVLVAGALFCAPAAASARSAVVPFPRYDHVFLLIEENHNFNQIIGNRGAPIINALAADYGLATRYTGVGDPSEPNYVAMLGGSTFGISSDDPYFFPGQTVNQPNLMSQLDAAGLSWKGYFQGMPYAGYRGYCFPARCNGIPDSDTQYVAKHNGIVNFANMHTDAAWAKQTPYSQLARDLASGSVPNLSYIIPDECDDMHGAPPWCVDSGKFGDVDDTYLVARGDAFVGQTVNAITSSSIWERGNNAIVITFDEGNRATDQIATIVVTNHGPRAVTDNTQYDHYSLLASLQQAFRLGCLQASCTATPMTPLFQPTGSTTTPALPAAFTPAPDGTDAVSLPGNPVKESPVTLRPGSDWQVVRSPSIGNLDNNLAAVSAASPTDAWAVGDYYDSNDPNVLKNLAEHWDGQSWTAMPLPNVGPNENTLLGVSELANGSTWAVGYDVNAGYRQQPLVEHFDGLGWQVVPTPSTAGQGSIFYGVSALADDDVWAVGGRQDSAGTWHPLAEHWNGKQWAMTATADPNGGENLLYAVSAVAGDGVYSTGQTGTSFPSSALLERWNGSSWQTLATPTDATESLDPFGLAGATLVGARESDLTPFTTLVAANGTLVASPNNGAGEQNLFSATTAADGSTWAGGWYIDANGDHQTLIEHGVAGSWSITPSPNPGNGDNGIAGITAIPGGGVWAVGIGGGKNPRTLIEFRH
jgi:hypothetical protein